MKNIIIGTAGHIDHGKTALIKALTGKETDRWEEEKRRGITIDLGFTYFDLPSGDRAGIIDVPGHEKFINNMLAGVIGMDLVMLVVAADEGVMPQTREHVDIMTQLGIEKTIVVLNKCDLVDDEWKDLVKEEIKEELKGSAFENANIVEVSAITGEGIDDLIKEIVHMTKDEVVTKDINTISRLPIDRCFSISGFGTIITGTLISGSIKKDDELELYPTNKRAKIRSIQVHGKDVKECFAGQRSAINISNLRKDEIKRGYVLAPPNSLENTMMLDVKLNILESSNRILQNRCRLHLFSGTSEVLCRAVLLDVKEVGPGESCYVQLRLEEKVAFKRGDKFIVRFYSPLETIGGGVILDANPTKKTPFNEEQLEEIKRKEEGSHTDIIELLIKKHPEMITIKEISKLTGLSLEEVNESIDELKDKILEFMKEEFKQLDAWSTDATYNVKISKKGKVFLGKKKSNNQKVVNKGHNKEKNYILKEGMLIQPLIDLGVFTKEGKVVNSKYDKYKQINRFIEIIDDEIKKNNYEELTILDFGCGKSYLTFVLYYYFVEIKKINVKMIGLDLKEDVINKCNEIAKKYKFDNLHFELGDINGFKYNNKVDMVITLHACDTATDYALYNAIKWNAKMIFSVPCCQHEFNHQMKAENLDILTKYGIIQERVAALMTDSVRGNLLECAGYKTQLLEFIDISHSPKNILIRASKSNLSKDKKEKSLKQVEDLKKEFNFNPTLYNLLKDDNLI